MLRLPSGYVCRRRLGLKGIASGSVHEWADGSSYNYTNFGALEPDAAASCACFDETGTTMQPTAVWRHVLGRRVSCGRCGDKLREAEPGTCTASHPCWSAPPRRSRSGGGQWSTCDCSGSVVGVCGAPACTDVVTVADASWGGGVPLELAYVPPMPRFSAMTELVHNGTMVFQVVWSSYVSGFSASDVVVALTPANAMQVSTRLVRLSPSEYHVIVEPVARLVTTVVGLSVLPRSGSISPQAPT